MPHMPAPILCMRRDTRSLVHMCHGDLDAPKQPTIVDQYGLLNPMPLSLKQEPPLIPLPSKELRRPKQQQDKDNGLPRAEQKRIKRLKRREQQNLKTMRPPDKAKAAIKAGQRTKPTKPRGQRKLRSLVYDLGADGHFPTEELRKVAGLKVIHKSTKRVLVADGHINHGEQEVELSFEGLSTKARTGDTFERFRESLMSVGKVNDNGNISIFTKNDVTVYKEKDVLIICKGKPILVGIHDEGGRYRIPLDQR